MREPMFRFKVLVKLTDHFTPVYVVAHRYGNVNGDLWFWAGENKIATFAAGEWIGVITDQVIKDASQ